MPTQEKPAMSAKKPYEPPRLVRYGTIKELTTGGTLHAQESSMGQPKRS